MLQSILMGIVQGLTEFLPVSSSGHLVLFKHFFGFEENAGSTFEIFLHLGTLFAVLIYFRKMIWELILSLTKWKDIPENQHHRHNRNLIMYLVIATFATGIIYLLFGKFFKSLFDQPLVVSFMLLITGIVIFASDFIKGGAVPAESMGFGRSIIIGIAQGMAIIPGISRSGTTVGTSIFTGLRRKDAASFSFLLSIPAILAGNLENLKELSQLNSSMLLNYLLGFFFSFAIGYLVISVFMGIIQKAKLKYFAFYCWFAGLASIIWIVSR